MREEFAQRRLGCNFDDASLFGRRPEDCSGAGAQVSRGLAASSSTPGPENTGSTNIASDSGPPQVPQWCTVSPI